MEKSKHEHSAKNVFLFHKKENNIGFNDKRVSNNFWLKNHLLHLTNRSYALGHNMTSE